MAQGWVCVCVWNGSYEACWLVVCLSVCRGGVESSMSPTESPTVSTCVVIHSSSGCRMVLWFCLFFVRVQYYTVCSFLEDSSFEDQYYRICICIPINEQRYRIMRMLIYLLFHYLYPTQTQTQTQFARHWLSGCSTGRPTQQRWTHDTTRWWSWRVSFVWLLWWRIWRVSFV